MVEFAVGTVVRRMEVQAKLGGETGNHGERVKLEECGEG